MRGLYRQTMVDYSGELFYRKINTNSTQERPHVNWIRVGKAQTEKSRIFFDI